MRWYYPIAAAPIYLVTLLPFPILYGISNALCFILYRILGYRVKVVRKNLTQSFPLLSDEQRLLIEKKYYLHLTDTIVESLKLFSMSSSSLMKRVKFHQVELFEEYYKSNQSCVLVLGHLGNWEWGGQAFQSTYPHLNLFGIYHPLNNQFFDWFMKRSRTRFGGGLIPMQQVIRDMVKLKSKFTVTAFIADQTPSGADSAYWLNFLNQPTPVFVGTEKLASKFNYPVIYAHLIKPKRGYYHVHFELITSAPQSTSTGEITKKHTQLLEQDIINQPEIWLWSHRRWKHQPTSQSHFI
ncbi:MAG: lysophospholipid acyltransferase family protein [Bacteroidia bacterium]|jgi:KDO2-lipid IV(A) lauroyltransferase|nr:lysophospholipid acyltransferase family protein [Bacteroidia bacterium]